MAVVNDKLTTVGGCTDVTLIEKTNSLLCYIQEKRWEQLLPPMPTERQRLAAVTTPTHLVVAGGRTGFFGAALSTVDVLDLNTLQWSSASSSPKGFQCPHMTLCGGYLYLSEHDIIFSCSVEELLKSCKPPSTNGSDGGSVWTGLTDIPVPHGASLATLRGHVLAIGAKNRSIHCYDRNTNSWIIIGALPTQRSDTLVAVLPSNELIVVGGEERGGKWCSKTEIGSTD